MATRADLMLLCRVGNAVAAIPARDVRETMRPLPVEGLTGAPDWVAGAAVIRGAAIPVVDAARLLTGAPGASPARFVTVRAGERDVALAVDAVLGLRALPADAAASLPPLLRDARAAEAVGALDRELLVVLAAVRGVPEGAWTPAP